MFRNYGTWQILQNEDRLENTRTDEQSKNSFYADNKETDSTETKDSFILGYFQSTFEFLIWLNNLKRGDEMEKGVKKNEKLK